MLRRPDAPVIATVTPRAWLLWAAIGSAIIIGVILYFRYERALTPLVA